MRRTLNETITRWQSRGVAYISDKLSVPSIFRIQTEDADAELFAEIEVEKMTVTNRSSHAMGDRYSYNWRVLEQTGSNPNLDRMANAIINISCFPSDGSRYFRKSMPYRDMLLVGGRVEVNLPRAETPTSFDLGKLIGLTIVIPNNDVQVWPEL